MQVGVAFLRQMPEYLNEMIDDDRHLPSVGSSITRRTGLSSRARATATVVSYDKATAAGFRRARPAPGCASLRPRMKAAIFAVRLAAKAAADTVCCAIACSSSNGGSVDDRRQYLLELAA